jgi:predicted Ser/Thr protein kinase/sugar lactone lactonase YvrE
MGMAGQPETLEGAKLGAYAVLAEIGRGGMAVVYKGRQESLNRAVAIKVLPLEFASAPELLRRFHREAEAMAALGHPNIVQIIDKGEREGIYYFVMEFVEGGSLKDVLREKDLTLDRMLDIVLMVAAGLEHAHAHGIVHRDLKPGNVLVEARSGVAKIADFGIAQLQTRPELSQLTSSHMSMGTLNYMAPEQKVDAKTVDHRADIYSFGVILYEMLTGDLPLGSFDPPSHVNKRIPRALDEIVLRCLKTSPQNRWQTIAECAAALKEVRATAGDVGVLTRAVKAAKEKAATAVSGTSTAARVVVGLVLVALLAGAYVAYAARGKLGGFLEKYTARSGAAAKPPGPAPPAPPPAAGLVPATEDAIATKEQAERAQLGTRYARKNAETGLAPRYAREKFEQAERLAADAEALMADGAYGRAASGFADALGRYRAAETAAAQGKRDEAAALDARRAAESARAHAETEKAPAEAAERWAEAERAFARGKQALETDLAFDVALAAFQEATTAYDRAARAVIERLRREQAIEAMERSSFDATGARKRAELAQAATAAPEEWKKAEDARAEAERVRAGDDPALAAVAYEHARQAYADAEARAKASDAEAKLRLDAESARRDLDAARGRADAAGARDLAADPYAKALEEAQAGGAAFADGRFEVARVRFEHARASFDDALAAAGREGAAREVEAARVAMSASRDKAAAARASEAAPDALERAAAEERAGDEERVNGRLADARARYEKAQSLYESAATAALGGDQQALERARDDLSEARYRAYQASAHVAAPLVFQRAAEEERAGDEARARGRPGDARARYERAQALYLEAARTAEGGTVVAGGPGDRPPAPGSAPPPGTAPSPPGGVGSGLPGGSTAPAPPPPGTSPPGTSPPGTSPQPLPTAPSAPPTALTASITFRAAYVKIGRDPGDVLFAKAIACDPVGGGFWLVDAKKGAVLRYAPDGAFRQEIAGLSAPYDVASAAAGDVYIADAGANEVIRVGADGRRLGKFGYRGAGTGEFHFPNAVAVAPSGDVHVLDCGNKRSQRFTPEGHYVGQIQIVSEKYAGIAADARGNVYVCAPREVKRVPASGGTAITFVGGVLPTAVAVDPAGRVYVCDAVGARVLVLGADGRKLAEVTTAEGTARLQYPIGVACDGVRLYVVDCKAAKKVDVYDVR